MEQSRNRKSRSKGPPENYKEEVTRIQAIVDILYSIAKDKYIDRTHAYNILD